MTTWRWLVVVVVVGLVALEFGYRNGRRSVNRAIVNILIGDR